MVASGLVDSVGALVPPAPPVAVDPARRGLLAAAVLGLGVVAPAHAADLACPRNSQNCLRTSWTPPPGTSPATIQTTVRTVVSSYPTSGQGGVDLGGWTWVEDNLNNSDTSSARLEFQSGIGNFAKFFNGGKPFVDDLTLVLDSDNVVQVKSSSRVGDSDMGVNQKRLAFLASKFNALGWTAPEPKY